MRKYQSLLELRLRLCNDRLGHSAFFFSFSFCIATEFEEYEEKCVGQHLSESVPQNCIFHADYVQDSTVYPLCEFIHVSLPFITLEIANA